MYQNKIGISSRFLKTKLKPQHFLLNWFPERVCDEEAVDAVEEAGQCDGLPPQRGGERVDGAQLRDQDLLLVEALPLALLGLLRARGQGHALAVHVPKGGKTEFSQNILYKVEKTAGQWSILIRKFNLYHHLSHNSRGVGCVIPASWLPLIARAILYSLSLPNSWKL